jgi:catechol 2,3-dioxygenase-like lactoylglutathione lyase family enzyme
MVTAVGAIVQATHQRAELVRFYREALGLGEPDAVGGHQYFMVGDIHLGIDSGDPRVRGPMPRTGVYFVVDDLEAQVAHMKQQGVAFSVEPVAENWGARVAVCRDPDGNFVTLMSGPRVPRSASARGHKKARAARGSRGSKRAGRSARKGRR